MGGWQDLSAGFNAGLGAFQTIKQYEKKEVSATTAHAAKQAAELKRLQIANAGLTKEVKTKTLNKTQVQDGMTSYVNSGKYDILNKTTADYGGLNGAAGFTAATDSVIASFRDNNIKGFTAANEQQYKVAQDAIAKYVAMTPEELAKEDMPADVKDFAMQIKSNPNLQHPTIVSMQDGTYNVVQPLDIMRKFDMPRQEKMRQQRLKIEQDKTNLQNEIDLETSKFNNPKMQTMRKVKADEKLDAVTSETIAKTDAEYAAKTKQQAGILGFVKQFTAKEGIFAPTVDENTLIKQQSMAASIKQNDTQKKAIEKFEPLVSNYNRLSKVIEQIESLDAKQLSLWGRASTELKSYIDGTMSEQDFRKYAAQQGIAMTLAIDLKEASGTAVADPERKVWDGIYTGGIFKSKGTMLNSIKGVYNEKAKQIASTEAINLRIRPYDLSQSTEYRLYKTGIDTASRIARKGDINGSKKIATEPIKVKVNTKDLWGN